MMNRNERLKISEKQKQENINQLRTEVGDYLIMKKIIKRQINVEQKQERMNR